jgi:hypothetical protein
MVNTPDGASGEGREGDFVAIFTAVIAAIFGDFAFSLSNGCCLLWFSARRLAPSLCGLLTPVKERVNVCPLATSSYQDMILWHLCVPKTLSTLMAS